MTPCSCFHLPPLPFSLGLSLPCPLDCGLSKEKDGVPIHFVNYHSAQKPAQKCPQDVCFINEQIFVSCSSHSVSNTLEGYRSHASILLNMFFFLSPLQHTQEIALCKFFHRSSKREEFYLTPNVIYQAKGEIWLDKCSSLMSIRKKCRKLFCSVTFEAPVQFRVSHEHGHGY